MALFVGLTSWQIIILAIIFIGIVVGAGIGTFMLTNRLKWPFTYAVIEDINGQGPVVTKRGRARIITVGDGGEELYFLKGLNKYKIGHGKRIGHNQVAWAVANDGLWYNVVFSDINTKLQELGVRPIDRDVRLAYAAARKLIDKRYDDRDFMQKYGVIIAFGMLFMCILAMGGFAWFISDKYGENAAINVETMKLAKEISGLNKDNLNLMNENLQNLNGVRSDSGLTR